jgi:hypothetical protein
MPRGTSKGVVYRVAYGHRNGPIPAVLSVAVVRLGNTSVFQDRSVCKAPVLQPELDQRIHAEIPVWRRSVLTRIRGTCRPEWLWARSSARSSGSSVRS